MIGVRLMGGLGNQMFQYATAFSLARQHGTDVSMDLQFFENIAAVDTPREYELDCFQLKSRFLEQTKRPAEDDEAIYLGRRGRLRQLKHRLGGHAWKIYREPHHNFDSEVLNLPDWSYLIGYWQTEKYFTNIRKGLLKEFAFKDEPTGKNKELLEHIKSTESVSIHVRRGDYVSNEHASKFHGAKGLDYYEAALKPILKQVKEPQLFVFSDDPEWCKQNLKFRQDTVYAEGNKKGHEDMRLMMRCKHNVIANSSFSWWGAWLNENPSKIVIAPKKWFNDPSINTNDVIPESWIRV